jgi:hypothetical protein
LGSIIRSGILCRIGQLLEVLENLAAAAAAGADVDDFLGV